jgi:hypothetical protein
MIPGAKSRLSGAKRALQGTPLPATMSFGVSDSLVERGGICVQEGQKQAKNRSAQLSGKGTATRAVWVAAAP